MKIHNEGIVASGGTVNNSGAVGRGARVIYPGTAGVRAADQPAESGAAKTTIGIITALSTEMHAVAAELRKLELYGEQTQDGRRYYSATIGNAGRVVATQAVRPGQQGASNAYHALSKFCSPNFTMFCGIAGRISDNIRLGDVVVSDEIIGYDRRKETDGGSLREADPYAAPALIRNILNAYFTRCGPRTIGLPIERQPGDPYVLVHGPIGTGEAVIASSQSEIRGFLTTVNRKTLAVETEATGLGAAFFEQAASVGAPDGWLLFRGISDAADGEKNDEYHDIAAQTAASALFQFLPFLLEY